MRKNLVKMVASSAPGTGTVSLSSVSGFMTFDTAFQASSLTRSVSYFISDEVAGKFEWGYGTYTNGVLTRQKVKGTISGTTLTEANPSKLDFNGTAADIFVTVTLQADTFVPAFPAANIGTNPANNQFNTGIPDGRLITGGNIGSWLPVLNTEYYTPFLWLGQGDVTQFAAAVHTGQTGGAGKFALYELGEDGLPGHQIVSFGTLTLTTSAWITQAAANWGAYTGGLPLPVGWYFIGHMYTATSTLPSMGMWPAATRAISPMGWNSSNQYYGSGVSLQYTSGSYSTGLPSGVPGRTYAFTGSGLNKLPCFALKPRF